MPAPWALCACDETWQGPSRGYYQRARSGTESGFAIFLIFTHRIRTDWRAAEHCRRDSRGVDEYPSKHAESVVLMNYFNPARFEMASLRPRCRRSDSAQQCSRLCSRLALSDHLSYTGAIDDRSSAPPPPHHWLVSPCWPGVGSVRTCGAVCSS